jgi:1-acyl-sn-glycerol-3-phosphate acyltransferase
MTPAAKSALFGRVFGWHIAGRLRTTFGRITVSGLEGARAALARGPVLFVANHSTWWDPLVILHLSTDVLRVDAYAMMNARNLARVPFFRRVGAFGVDLESPADGARGIRYAAKLLRAPSPGQSRAVWLFPQGEERPSHEPIVARPGAAAIARVCGEHAQVVAVGLRYVFAAEERPQLAIAFGPAARALTGVAAETARQEAALTAVLARLDAGGDRDDVVLHQRQAGALARMAERMLGKIAG